MISARHVLRADLESVIDTLTDAFLDDPVTQWLLDEGDDYEARVERWMGFAVDTGMAHGHIYSAGENRAAALWAAPDVSLFDAQWGQRMVETLTELLGEAAIPKLGTLAEAMSTAHIDESHFYLFVLGTHREAQSRGLGSALLRPMLDHCDAQGLPVHLESSNPQNVPFYERHGFVVLAEAQLGEEGPVLRPMRRTPR